MEATRKKGTTPKSENGTKVTTGKMKKKLVAASVVAEPARDGKRLPQPCPALRAAKRPGVSPRVT